MGVVGAMCACFSNIDTKDEEEGYVFRNIFHFSAGHGELKKHDEYLALDCSVAVSSYHT